MLRFSIGTTDQMEKLISILKKILKVNRWKNGKV
jgi:histidinol-phosphate/aromatic aminotransferase/cobyric acid decarboxylase-like protein